MPFLQIRKGIISLTKVFIFEKELKQTELLRADWLCGNIADVEEPTRRFISLSPAFLRIVGVGVTC